MVKDYDTKCDKQPDLYKIEALNNEDSDCRG